MAYKRLITDTIKLRTGWLLVLLGLLMVPAQARMYQWNDPDTGTTQLSGTPPSWYRSSRGGPRVFVFEKGQLIDDTGREVSEQRRRFLREEAINQAIAADEEKRGRALPADRELPPLDPSAILELLPPLPDEPLPETLAGDSEGEQSVTDDLSPEEIRTMRELITEWENRRQREAREILETDNPPGGAQGR